MPNLKKMSLWVFCLMLHPFLLHSCQDSEVVCHQFQEVNTEGWRPTDTLTFTLPPLPTDSGTCLVDVFAQTRVLRSYPFTNMTLLVELCADDGTPLHRDTIQCQLFDDADNAAGPGFVYLTSDHKLTTYSLSCPHRPHTLRVAHLMRLTMLTGVTHIGVKVIKSATD